MLKFTNLYRCKKLTSITVGSDGSSFEATAVARLMAPRAQHSAQVKLFFIDLPEFQYSSPIFMN
jgi:hypothetical protein